MAGGIDWFRWHHGSVTDPKFQLVAKRAGARTSDVLAVWAFVLEKASASEVRGHFGEVDCEAVDCLFGMDDGSTDAILSGLTDRKLVSDGYIVAWDKRQPKREREDNTAAERKRDQRERDAANERQGAQCHSDTSDVTPCHAMSRQKTPREEESREEKKEEKKTPRKRDEFLLPDWIPLETWASYLKTRTKKRSDNNAHALGLIVKDLEGFRALGHDPVAILNASIKGGWAGVFEPKPQAADRGGGSKQTALEARNRAVVEEFLREAS